MQEKLKTVVRNVRKAQIRSVLEAVLRKDAKPLEDFEYLIHHIENIKGVEEVHHCYLYDHIGNLFEQTHLVVKDGRATLDGKVVKDGTFHVIKGLEKTQKVVWTDEEAKEAKIRPKAMRAGMTLKQKAKEW